MCDATEPARGEIHHLVIPRVSGEWPPVAEHHRLSFTPILEIDLCAVLRPDGAALDLRLSHRCRAHSASPFLSQSRCGNSSARLVRAHPAIECRVDNSFEKRISSRG